SASTAVPCARSCSSTAWTNKPLPAGCRPVSDRLIIPGFVNLPGNHHMLSATDQRTVRRALISVSDKTGIVEFARGLQARGVELLSTGGTARLLAEQGLEVTEVADYTQFPEMMDGRVKTLHPKVHGGLLGRRGIDDAVMAQHGILPIDLLAVNLYPFEQTIARPGCTLAEAIENIDIGG